MHAALMAVAVDDGVDLAFGERADEHDAGRAQRHLAGVRDVAGVDGDVEAGRQRDVAHLGGGAGQHAGQVAAIPAADTGHADDGDDERDHDVQATHGAAPAQLFFFARSATGSPASFQAVKPPSISTTRSRPICWATSAASAERQAPLQ